MLWKLPKTWTWTPLGPHLAERAEPIGSLAPEEAAGFDRLRGVSNREGIIDPPFDRVRPIKDPSRYVVLRVGYFAYNPMRINVGSIGLVLDQAQAGKISPDPVVFTTRRTLLPGSQDRCLRRPRTASARQRRCCPDRWPRRRSGQPL